MARFKDLQDTPARRHPLYTEVVREWQMLLDVFSGVSAWSTIGEDGELSPTSRAIAYLPKHPKEEPDEYLWRFRNTEFPANLGETIREYVDLLFANGIKVESDGSFTDDWQDLSDWGASGDSLCGDIATWALLLGTFHIFIDYVGDRPRWVPIFPTSVSDWEHQTIDGVSRLTRVSVLTSETKLIHDNYQVVDYVTEYRRGGSWQRWRYYFDDERSEWVFEDVDTGVLKAKGAPLTEIPLVTFHGSRSVSNRMVGDRPMRKMADLTLALYRVISDYRRKMRLCNTPVPVRYDMNATGDLVISPNRIIDIKTPDGFFSWSEPSTNSLEASRVEMDDLRGAIALDSTKFLRSPVSRVSAGATDLSVAPLQASLFGFGQQFAQSLSQCVGFHQQYLRDDSEVLIEIVPTVRKQQAKDSQFAFSVQSLYKEGIISRHSSVIMLNESNYISDKIAEKELELPNDRREQDSSDSTDSTDSTDSGSFTYPTGKE